jgi:ABC-type multidrug transport system fused ATPase/permease subunit
MIKKDFLLKRLKGNFIWSIVTVVLFLGVTAYFVWVLITNIDDLVQVIIDSIIMLICVFMVAVQVSWAISYGLDIPLVKKDQYQYVTGKMVRCARVVTDKKTKKTTYFDPVIKDKESGEEVQISVAGVEPNHVYKIMYLKHSKMGVIEQKIK